MAWPEEKIYANCVLYLDKVLGELTSSDDFKELDLIQEELSDFARIFEIFENIKWDYDRISKETGSDPIKPHLRKNKIENILK